MIFARAYCTARPKPCYPELIIRNTLRRNFEITFTEEKPLEKEQHQHDVEITMDSKSPPGYSEEIMVAQPVDSNTAARDSMSPAPGSAKEAQQADAMSDSFGLPEDSPQKTIEAETT